MTRVFEKTTEASGVERLLRPRSVAVVGASRTPSALGRRVLDELIAGGFEGPIYPVNPQAGELAGRRCYPSARELPDGVDLAVIAVSRDAVLAAVDDCAAANVRSLVVITAGFGEVAGDGRALQQTLRDRVRANGMRMVGPNCMGLINTHLHLNASFSPLVPPAGRVAFSSQSGALGVAILDLATDREIGMSTFVSVGNKADISSNDLLEYWESDPDTSVILLYLESFGNPRKFAQLARRIGREKPIVAVKAGRSRAGLRAASSHTAALAASDAVVDELFRATGVIRANTIDEMFDVASYLASQPLPPGRRVGIVTNAGGPGILAGDACEGAGLSVVEFSAATRARLAEFLPPAASLGNPVDMVASAGEDAYRRAVAVALAADEVDALIVIYTPVDHTQAAPTLQGIARGIAEARSNGVHKPVLACLMADAARPKPLRVGSERIPAFPFPENAARALSHAASYAEWRLASPGRLVTFDDVRADEARTVCTDAVAARGESWLTEEELQRLLAAYRLPVVSGVVTRGADEAVEVAASMGFPVVAKISAQDLIHKTEAGGVITSLRTKDEVRQAAADLLASAAARGLQARGVLIQPMVTGGVETMIGVTHDPLFGALVGFGLGGTEVELEQDLHFRSAPLTDRDAGDLIRESRALPRLTGYRGRPPGDITSLTGLLLRVSQMASDLPQLLELDLNPVIVRPDGQGCAIVDVRARVWTGQGRRQPA